MRKWWWYLSPLAVLALWQILSSTGVLSAKTPSPVTVAKGLYYLVATGLPPGYHLQGHVLASLIRVLMGFGFAVVLAVPIGVLMGSSRTFDGVLDPLVEAIRPVPPLAWLPLAVLWFGIGYFSGAFIILLGVFFPVLLNTVSGVKGVDPHLSEAALTLGARRRTVVARVLVPGAMPSIITGVRIGLGIGWMTLIAAELAGVKSGYGLGYMILTGRDVGRYDLVVAGMVVIGVIGFLMDLLIKLAEKRLLRWR